MNVHNQCLPCKNWCTTEKIEDYSDGWGTKYNQQEKTKLIKDICCKQCPEQKQYWTSTMKSQCDAEN
jgi:hypothetical protein